MSTHDIRIDYEGETGEDCTKVLVSAVPHADALAMLGQRWDENSLVSALYDFICDEGGQADIYICETSEPMEATC